MSRRHARILSGAIVLRCGLVLGACTVSPALAQGEAGHPLTGFYVAPVVSHSSLQSTVRFAATPTRAAAQFNDVGGNTIYAGARGGVSRVLANGVFLGLDAAGRYAIEPYPTTILNAVGYRYSLSTKYELTATGRAGFTVGRTAIYAQGGVSHSRVDLSLDGVRHPRGLTTPTGGLGFETAITDALSLRFDWMADRSILRDPMKVTLVRWNAALGLSYRF